MHESDLRLLLRALRFAAEKHRNQRRKDEDASPYINHPIAVAQTLVDVGHVSDVATIAAAILHDTIEDTETTADELGAAFGPAIAAIVAEVTDDKDLSYTERKRLQVEHAGSASESAQLVKLADKICNVSDILEAPPASWSDARKAEYVRWASEVIDQVRGVNSGLEARFDELLAQTRT